MTQSTGKNGVTAGSKRAAAMALRTIELQRKAFAGAMRGIGSLQDRTGRMLHRFAKNASWVPEEGRQVVDEWTKVTKRGRKDFEKTVEKSFDLLVHYFERVKEGGPALKKKSSTRQKRTAKKSGRKKPAAES